MSFLLWLHQPDVQAQSLSPGLLGPVQSQGEVGNLPGPVQLAGGAEAGFGSPVLLEPYLVLKPGPTNPRGAVVHPSAHHLVLQPQ